MALEIACPPGVLTLPNTLSCSSFYECLEGNMIIEKSCPEGLLYNATIGSCDLASKVTCASGVDLATMLTMLLASYSVIYNGHQKGRIDTKKECDPGQYYYTSHALCEKYYLCADGVAYEKSCPNGLNYNANTRMCDYEPIHGTCVGDNQCAGGDLTLNTVVIKSHQYVTSTPLDNNQNCSWSFEPCETCGTIIQVDFTYFSLENQAGKDALTFEIAGNPVLRKEFYGDKTGNKVMFDLSGYRNMRYPLKMDLRIDNETKSAGFEIVVRTLKDLPEVPNPPIYGSVGACGGDLEVSGKPLRIYSHFLFNETDSTYEANMSCTWNLAPCATCDKLVIVEVERFELEDSVSCKNDWLAIGDPSDSQTRIICGNNIPAGSTYVLRLGDTNKTSINFSTDRSNNKAGFSLRIYGFDDRRRFTPEVTRLLSKAN